MNPIELNRAQLLSNYIIKLLVNLIRATIQYKESVIIPDLSTFSLSLYSSTEKTKVSKIK